MSGTEFTEKQLEELELLGNLRPKQKGKAAVRREDIAEFAKLRSKAQLSAGLAPTKEEHDLLVYDVRNIIKALNAIGAALS